MKQSKILLVFLIAQCLLVINVFGQTSWPQPAHDFQNSYRASPNTFFTNTQQNLCPLYDALPDYPSAFLLNDNYFLLNDPGKDLIMYDSNSLQQLAYYPNISVIAVDSTDWRATYYVSTTSAKNNENSNEFVSGFYLGRLLWDNQGWAVSWENHLIAQLQSVAYNDGDNTIELAYIKGNDFFLEQISTKDGRSEWERRTSQLPEVFTIKAGDPFTGNIILTSVPTTKESYSSVTLYLVDGSSGDLIWSNDIVGDDLQPVDVPILVTDEGTIVTAFSPSMMGFKSVNGSVAWQVNIGSNYSMVLLERTLGTQHVVAVSTDSIQVIDTKTGKVKSIINDFSLEQLWSVIAVGETIIVSGLNQSSPTIFSVDLSSPMKPYFSEMSSGTACKKMMIETNGTLFGYCTRNKDYQKTYFTELSNNCPISPPISPPIFPSLRPAPPPNPPSTGQNFEAIRICLIGAIIIVVISIILLVVCNCYLLYTRGKSSLTLPFNLLIGAESKKSVSDYSLVPSPMPTTPNPPTAVATPEC
eukprot:TRINITY_DN7603_c0_g1_i1.p1 TRINITY_DN7603_c0_g1~~TRINITY_DN7603_c0_g1_i1.p1  ORF type:complete len:527 (-),score=95.30 TRINITY_DN7603_c0_g1_i1:58-1638(-)